MINPLIYENSGKGERAYDIYSRLLKNRIIFLGTPVDDTVANSIMAQMIYLDSVAEDLEGDEKDIHFYINSPGGSVTAGLGIFDVMNHVESDVRTYCIGQACSMGALLLSSGAKGKRFALPSSRIMIHQPLGGAKGQATDIEIQAQEILKLKDYLSNILAKNTGQPLKTILDNCERDKFFSAQEALDYGLIDGIYKNGKLDSKKPKRNTRRKNG